MQFARDEYVLLSRRGKVPRGEEVSRLLRAGAGSTMVCRTVTARPTLIEFPADDTERARRFWAGLLGAALQDRGQDEGSGWETRDPAGGPAVGVHARGRGPGDSFSLPYFAVDDVEAALERVTALGGTVIHPGARWAICKDSEGSPFGLAGLTALDSP